MKDVPAETWAAALAAVKDGVSLRAAAETHQVSREALRQRHLGLVPVDARKGPQLTYLSEGGDRGILEIVQYRALRGAHVSYGELRQMLREASRLTGTRPLTDDFPNVKFVTRWLERQPRLPVGHVKLEEEQVDTIKRYFDNLKEALETFGLADKPERVWSCDRIDLGSSGKRVCAKRLKVQTGEHVMACMSATGKHMPLLHTSGGETWWMDDENATIVEVDSGDQLFLHWFKGFMSRLPPERPQLVLVDGRHDDFTLEVLKYGMDNNVHIFRLPVQTSHFLQPLDLAVSVDFKRHYSQTLKTLPAREDDLAGIAQNAFKLACSPDNAKEAFKKAGVFPLSLETMIEGVRNKSALRDILPHVAFALDPANAQELRAVEEAEDALISHSAPVQQKRKRDCQR